MADSLCDMRNDSLIIMSPQEKIFVWILIHLAYYISACNEPEHYVYTAESNLTVESNRETMTSQITRTNHISL